MQIRRIGVFIGLVAIVGISLFIPSLSRTKAETLGTDLHVSSSGHYLEKLDNTPFFWFGDLNFTDGSTISYDLTDEQAQTYLEDRKNDGYTVVTTFVLKFGSDTTPNVYNQLPFFNGDPSTPNPEFFRHIDVILTKAQSLGLHIELVTGSNQNNQLGTDPNKARAFGEWVGNRYKNQPNIIWGLNHDYDDSPENRNLYHSMVEGLVKGVTGQSIAWNQTSDAWKYLTATIHSATPSSSDYFHTDPWLTFNGHETWNDHDSVHSRAIHDYNLQPAKMSVNSESAIFGFDNPVATRHTLWENRMAGSFISFWSNRDTPDPDRQEARRFIAYWTQLSWWKFVPDQSIIKSNPGSDIDTVAAMLSTDKDRLLVYIPAGKTAQLQFTGITAKNSVIASWYNPANGQAQNLGSYSTSDTPTVSVPGGWSEAVLQVQAS